MALPGLHYRLPCWGERLCTTCTSGSKGTWCDTLTSILAFRSPPFP